MVISSTVPSARWSRTGRPLSREAVMAAGVRSMGRVAGGSRASSSRGTGPARTSSRGSKNRTAARASPKVAQRRSRIGIKKSPSLASSIWREGAYYAKDCRCRQTRFITAPSNKMLPHRYSHTSKIMMEAREP